MRSQFSRGAYRGYEVGLRVHRRGRRYEPVPAQSPTEIYRFMAELGQESAERTYALLMDTKRRIHGVYEVSKGSVDSCHVDPKEVFKAALVTNSPSFALVHNHPSGIVEPSTDDEAIVAKIAEGAALLGLDFADSLIIADSRYFSFQEAGRMRR